MSKPDRMRFFITTLGAALLSLMWASPSRAITFTGSSGTLAASADFELSGSTLTVTLTNTSTNTALDPTDVLTAVAFNTTKALTPVSASLPTGTTVWYGSITNTGDGWGYGSGLSDAHGENSAISATGAFNGLGHSNFSGASNALDGLAYGILPAGYTGVGANTGIKGHGPLIQNSVVFTLTAAAGFSLSELGSSVVFQYGTATTDTCFGGSVVPEPSSLAIAGLGGLGLFGYGLRRRRTK